jgi:16S rRNA G966 N2-methylase RsmD
MKETATMLGIEGIKIVRNDVFRFIRKAGTPCDIVFADPPYDLGSLPGLPGLVLDHNLLVPGGWLILEHSSRISFHGHPCFVEQRVYGEVNFTFFQKGTGLVLADQQKSV